MSALRTIKAKEMEIKQLNLIEADFKSNVFSSSFSGRKKLEWVGIQKEVKENNNSASCSYFCLLLRSGCYFLVQHHETKISTDFSFKASRDGALSPLTLVIRIYNLPAILELHLWILWDNSFSFAILACMYCQSAWPLSEMLRKTTEKYNFYESMS